ncbi:MAG: 16S rRNA (uracil(1498)-N(3))-methyltransferase [Acholeplasmatales bacterium]|nr:16S rRNA (uracil(1498)-N(3))-methyltransferase [Acholeplasmatales bacterium]
MQKYFIPKESLMNKVIDNSDAFHIIKVMRFRIGDEILVSDNEKTYLSKITALENNKVSFEIVHEETGTNELPVFVTIFQGYPKGDKMEDIIKHSTELGASAFYGVMMKRSIVKIDEKKKDSKIERFNKICKEASEQSLRFRMSEFKDIIPLKNIDFEKYDKKIVCYEEFAKESELSNFKSIVSSLKPNDKVAVLIGPEGGIDDSEIEYLKKLGFTLCGLGPRILRTETASMYVLSTISYEMELK